MGHSQSSQPKVYIAARQLREHGRGLFWGSQDEACGAVPNAPAGLVAHVALADDIGSGKKLAPRCLERADDELSARLEQWASACLCKAWSRHEAQSSQTKRSRIQFCVGRRLRKGRIGTLRVEAD